MVIIASSVVVHLGGSSARWVGLGPARVGRPLVGPPVSVLSWWWKASKMRVSKYLVETAPDGVPEVFWLDDESPDPETVLAEPEIQKLAQERAESLD